MGRRIRSRWVLILLLPVLIAACTDLLLDAIEEALQSAAQVLPARGLAITGHETITVTFRKAMDQDTLKLSGTLGEAAHAWVSATTLVLSPVTFWSQGEGKSLRIECVVDDVTTRLDYGYDVFHGVCVGSGANTGPAGTTLQPLATIPAGITRVADLYTTGEVRVSQGTYTSDWRGDAASRIIMQDGISLYGGYAEDFTGRDPAGYVTVIEDTSSTGGTTGADPPDPNRAVDFDNVSAATALDGFTIKAGEGDRTTAILCYYSSPVISRNTIQGSLNTTGERRWAVYNYRADPTLSDNVIHAGGGSAVDICAAVLNEYSSPLIRGNAIDGGSCRTTSGYQAYGIRNRYTDSNPVIQANTITAGTGYTLYGIHNWGQTNLTRIFNNLIVIDGGSGASYGIYNETASPLIRSNTIVCGQAGVPAACIRTVSRYTDPLTIVNNLLAVRANDGSGYGIYEDGADADAEILYNNGFHNLGLLAVWNLYYDADGDGALTTIGAVESDLTAESFDADGNVKENPAFADPGTGDYHYSAAAACLLTRGGLDLSPAFDDDREEADRTVPWSMGAYEADGACQ
jgi:hypothetical protein